MNIIIGTLNCDKDNKVVKSNPFIENKPFCNEVYQVAITDHPAATLGVPKVVATTGKAGNVCFHRSDAICDTERAQIVEFVKEWQQRGI